MKAAIFLDRDGTLLQDAGYTYKESDLSFLPFVIEGLKELQRNFPLFIVTNQSGINRGYFTEEQMQQFHAHMLHELKNEGIEIKKIYFSPHRPDEPSETRKPSPGLLDLCKKEFEVDLKSSWVVGDKISDIELAERRGSLSVLLMTGSPLTGMKKLKAQPPTYIASNFQQAVQFICRTSAEKIIPRPELKKLIQEKRGLGKKIVSLNGTFDLTHSGHQKILEEAKAQGDILIVALNSDASVKQNKGPLRPLNNEKARLLMMSSFPNVDYVTCFDEKTPISLLEEIKPDVHVNGSEYGENCIEAPTVKKYGGRIHVVELKEGFSSSNLIQQKLRENQPVLP